MWAGEVDHWLDDFSKLWPIILSLAGACVWIITQFTRKAANDKQIEGLSKTVDELLEIVRLLKENLARSQSAIEALQRQYADVCRENRELRDAIAKNTSNIDYILGRMDFGTRQRKDPGGR